MNEILFILISFEGLLGYKRMCENENMEASVSLLIAKVIMYHMEWVFVC